MEKFLNCKKQNLAYRKQNIVFQNKGSEKPSAAPTSQAAQRENLHDTYEEGLSLNVNVDANFDSDPDKVFEALGRETEKVNPALTAKAIKKSFMDTLASGKTIEEAWAFLQSKDCQTAAVVKGLLKFFAGQVGTNEIKLTEFFKPYEMKIGGPETLRYAYLKLRQKMLVQSMQALASMQDELPNLPPNKLS
jgi:hypothetical protein